MPITINPQIAQLRASASGSSNFVESRSPSAKPILEARLGIDGWIYDVAWRVLRCRSGLLTPDALSIELGELVKKEMPKLFQRIEDLTAENRTLRERAQPLSTWEAAKEAAKTQIQDAVQALRQTAPAARVLPATIGEMKKEEVAALINPGQTESFVGQYGRFGGPRAAEVQPLIDAEREMMRVKSYGL